MIKFKKGETSLKVKPENEELDTWRMTAKQNPEVSHPVSIRVCV